MPPDPPSKGAMRALHTGSPFFKILDLPLESPIRVMIMNQGSHASILQDAKCIGPCFKMSPGPPLTSPQTRERHYSLTVPT